MFLELIGETAAPLFERHRVVQSIEDVSVSGNQVNQFGS